MRVNEALILGLGDDWSKKRVSAMLDDEQARETYYAKIHDP